MKIKKIGGFMTEEIANNENNVILKLDDGTILENRFMEIDGVFYCVKFELKYWNEHSASLVETGKVFKKIEMGKTKAESRYYWNKLVRRLPSLKGTSWEDNKIKKI